MGTSTKSWGTILVTAPDASLAEAFEYEFLTQYDLEASTYYDSSKKLPEIASNEESDSFVDKSEKSQEDSVPDDICAYTSMKKIGDIDKNPIIVSTPVTSHSTKWMPILNTLFSSGKDDQ